MLIFYEVFCNFKIKSNLEKKNKCKGRIKIVNFEKKDIDLYFFYILVEKCLKMKESYIFFFFISYS